MKPGPGLLIKGRGTHARHCPLAGRGPARHGMLRAGHDNRFAADVGEPDIGRIARGPFNRRPRYLAADRGRTGVLVAARGQFLHGGERVQGERVQAVRRGAWKMRLGFTTWRTTSARAATWPATILKSSKRFAPSLHSCKTTCARMHGPWAALHDKEGKALRARSCEAALRTFRQASSESVQPFRQATYRFTPVASEPTTTWGDVPTASRARLVMVCPSR